MSLAGKRILNTRPERQNRELSERLIAAGAEVIEFPLLEIRSVEVPKRELERLAKIVSESWFLFTSPNAVQGISQSAANSGISLTGRAACIGPATAESARAAGFVVEFVASVFDSAHFGPEFLDHLANDTERLKVKQIVFPCGRSANDTLPTFLTSSGFQVHEIVVYESVMPEYDHATARRLKDALLDGSLHAVIVTSSQAAWNFASVFAVERGAGSETRHKDINFVAIGQQTSESLFELGFRNVSVAKEATVEGLAAATEFLLGSLDRPT